MSKKKKEKSKEPSSINQDLKDAILIYLKKLKNNKPISERQISKHLEPRYTKKEILQALYKLTANGILSLHDSNKFQLKSDKRPGSSKVYHGGEEVIGIVDMTKSGSAYIVTEEEGEDIFVSPRDTNKAMHGDKVKVLIHQRKRRPEGIITEIIQRNRTIFIGRVDKEKYCFVIPNDSDLHVDFFIPDSKSVSLKHGDKVIVEMISWPEKGKNPIGRVIEKLADNTDDDIEMKSILIQHGFYLDFEKPVLKEVHAISTEIADEEIKKRKDFRNTTTFTIDPLDAKDFDDALSVCEIETDIWEIGIHIADVSHYVREDSALDKAAYKRATSVYLADRVAPMLPEALSNIICSLRPDEDKLCYSAVFTMNQKAEVLSEWFGRTVIRSDRRFVYEEAQEIINDKKGDFYRELQLLDTLAHILREKRLKEGSLNFDSQELRFQLDEKGFPVGVVEVLRQDTNKLIEDFMLLANRRVAHFISEKEKELKKNIPFVYRVHDFPDEDKLKDFATFAKLFGHTFNYDNMKNISAEMNALMDKVEGRPEERMLQQLAIRSMAKAIYSTKNIGHYGLGFDFYTHFTSPIRRYPDVMVHRLLQKVLNGTYPNQKAEIEDKCKHCSERERAAMESERESVKYKMTQYMESHIGETFSGIISGVKTWGVYVELPEYNTEGLIRLDCFSDDRYIVDEKKMQLRGTLTDKIYRLGDEITVKLIGIDKQKKTIDFDLG
ncbi:MAG: ribonuclease R [Chitinophagales bacterium]|nr:ribonuclease R [Chitinophagales bacterium]